MNEINELELERTFHLAQNTHTHTHRLNMKKRFSFAAQAAAPDYKHRFAFIHHI